MAALLTVLAPILEALFNAFERSFNDWLTAQRAEQTQRELGVAQTTTTINKESADAERRASEVAVNHPDVGAVIGVAFNRFGTTDSFWAFVFTGAGAARLIALWINGRWLKSPHIRIGCAVFGAITWVQIAYLFVEAALINNTPTGTGPAVYGLLAGFELISIHRAAFDARYHRP